MADAKLVSNGLQLNLGSIQNALVGPQTPSRGTFLFGGSASSVTFNTATTMGTNVQSSAFNTACEEYFFNPTSDSTSVSFSILSNTGTAQSLRYHNRIWYTTTGTYNYSNSSTSINLTNNANMGYTTYTNTNAEYGMWVRLRFLNIFWTSIYHNHPTFSMDYWYIGTNNATYHGRIDGGLNAMPSTGSDITTLLQHKFTFNKTCEYSVGGGF